MNMILETCSKLTTITGSLINCAYQLYESSLAFDLGETEEATKLQRKSLDDLDICVKQITEVVNGFDDMDAAILDEMADCFDNALEEIEDDTSDLDPGLSPETRAAFNRMMSLTDKAISREHLSRLAANTDMQTTAAQMHKQAESIWNDAFGVMCQYVVMSHEDILHNIEKEK